MAKLLLLSASVLCLGGCLHPVILMKATQVTHNNQSFVHCEIHVSDKASVGLKQSADNLCRMAQIEFSTVPAGTTEKK